MNATVVLEPFILYFPPLPGKEWHEDFRSCTAGLCLPCPSDRVEFGNTFEKLELGYPIIATITTAAMVLLLVSYALLPKKTTRRNMHTVGIAISNLVFALSFMLSFNVNQQQKTVCIDTITRATGLHNPRCAASGMFMVYGLLSSRLWLFLWILQMHLLIVWNKNVNYRLWYPIALGVIVPLICACAAIPFYEYITGPMCLPRLGLPIQLLLEVPVALSDGLSSIVQCWTFVHIFRKMINGRRRVVADDTRASHRHSTITSTPAADTWHLLARPMTFTTLSLVGTILFASSFFGIAEPYGLHGGITPAWMPFLMQWLKCLVAPGANVQQCAATNGKYFNYPLMAACWYYVFFIGLFFVGICFRSEMFRGLKELTLSGLTKENAEFSGESVLSSNGHRKEMATLSTATEFSHTWKDQESNLQGSQTGVSVATTAQYFPVFEADSEMVYEKMLFPQVYRTPTQVQRPQPACLEADGNLCSPPPSRPPSELSNFRFSTHSGASLLPDESTPSTPAADSPWDLGGSLPWGPVAPRATHPSQRGSRNGVPTRRYSSDSDVRPFNDTLML